MTASRLADLWCRVEEEAGRVRRVNVMHPNGEILFSFPPEKFEPELVRRMRTGQVRARLDEAPGSGSTLEWIDEAGRPLLRETVNAPSITPPEDGDER